MAYHFHLPRRLHLRILVLLFCCLAVWPCPIIQSDNRSNQSNVTAITTSMFSSNRSDQINTTGVPTIAASSKENKFSTLQIGLATGFIITFLVSLLGNSLVIHVVRTTPSMRTSVNLYIANMASSDIISAAVCTPMSVRNLFWDYSWIDGLIGLLLCRFVYFLFYSSFACSTFNLVAIAVDRFLAVTKPLYRYSFRTVKINIAVIWMASSLLSIPIIYGYVNKVDHHGNFTTCFDLDRDEAYKVGVTTMALLCYIIPLLCATMLYTITGCTLRVRTKSDLGFHSQRRKTRAKISANKATKLMVTIIVIFALCWAPYFAYHVAKGWLDWLSLYRLLEWYYRPLCFFLASTSGALNPCLYLLFNSNFKNGFKKAFLCRDERRRGMSFELQQLSKRRERSRSSMV